MELSKKDLIEIENQLRCPSGQNGLQMAKTMHQSNIGMIRRSIDFLTPEKGEKVLELGHGNCEHLPEVLLKAADLSYCGLEISGTMRDEAIRLNKKYMCDGKVEFKLYDGKTVPFGNILFDKIFTVNTLYFWEDPAGLLDQLFEILRPSGKCVVTFAQKEFMKRLPFVNKKFRLYDNADISAFIRKSKFECCEIHDFSEDITGKHGEKVRRDYSVIVSEKKG